MEKKVRCQSCGEYKKWIDEYIPWYKIWVCDDCACEELSHMEW